MKKINFKNLKNNSFFINILIITIYIGAFCIMFLSDTAFMKYKTVLFAYFLGVIMLLMYFKKLRDDEQLTKRLEVDNSDYSAYLTDEMYTPILYKGRVIKKPNYKGINMHSVDELEAMCKQYIDYCHQQKIIKQNCMKHIVKLKFNVDMIDAHINS